MNATDPYTSSLYASHEIAEAATDPDGSNGYRDTIPRGEIGDICGTAGYPYGTLTLAQIFSQEVCQCISATRPVIVDPCASKKGTARLCCQKPWLPVCSALD